MAEIVSRPGHWLTIPYSLLTIRYSLIPVILDPQQRKGAQHVWWRYRRRRRVQVRAVELGGRCDAEEAEAPLHLVLHQFEQAHDAGSARRGKCIALHAAGPDPARASRRCLRECCGR